MLYIKDLNNKSQVELNEMVDDLRAKLFVLHFKNSTGQLNDTHKIKLIRRDIARVLMAIAIKESKEGKKVTKTKSKIKKRQATYAALKQPSKPKVELPTHEVKQSIKETSVKEVTTSNTTKDTMQEEVKKEVNNG